MLYQNILFRDIDFTTQQQLIQTTLQN